MIIFKGGDSSLSIANKFENLVKNTRTNNHDTVSERYKRITKRINLDFRGIDSDLSYSRYVGSYGRATAIKGFSDVDMLVQLPYETYSKYNQYAGNGQSALLQAVRNSIRKTYPNTDVGGDGQVVVIKFSDGMMFEVVPAFINKDGISYTYPDSNTGGRWRTCNPVAEINAINQLNNQYNKNVKYLVRIMKAWRNENNVPISGMLLETLAMNFLIQYEYANKSYFYYDWMVRDFLKYLSQQNPEQSYWKAHGSGQQVWRKDNFEYKAKQGYLRAVEAIEDEEKYPSLANNTWRKIFGKCFIG